VSRELVTQLAAATKRIATARANLVKVMRTAHEQGMTLREIGDATGLSHETVRRLVRDE
jgi:DNA-binding transcriptional regulator LsrR (DeoR family)